MIVWQRNIMTKRKKEKNIGFSAPFTHIFYQKFTWMHERDVIKMSSFIFFSVNVLFFFAYPSCFQQVQHHSKSLPSWCCNCSGHLLKHFQNCFPRHNQVWLSIILSTQFYQQLYKDTNVEVYWFILAFLSSQKIELVYLFVHAGSISLAFRLPIGQQFPSSGALIGRHALDQLVGAGLVGAPILDTVKTLFILNMWLSSWRKPFKDGWTCRVFWSQRPTGGERATISIQSVEVKSIEEDQQEVWQPHSRAGGGVGWAWRTAGQC